VVRGGTSQPGSQGPSIDPGAWIQNKDTRPRRLHSQAARTDTRRASVGHQCTHTPRCAYRAGRRLRRGGVLSPGHVGKAGLWNELVMALPHPDGRDEFSGARGTRFQVFRCTTCFPTTVSGTGDSDDEEPEGVKGSDGGGQGTDALCCSSECCCCASGGDTVVWCITVARLECPLLSPWKRWG
jgi:hypothetical protein